MKEHASAVERVPALRMKVYALLVGLLFVSVLLPCVAAESKGDDHPYASWVKTSNGLPTSGEFWGVKFVDVNKDNKLDVVGADTSAGNIVVYLGDGTGNWTAVSQQPPPGGGSDIAAGDFDKDGNVDLVAGAGGVAGVHLYKGDGAGKFTEMTSGSGLPTTSNWRGFAVGDVNKDGNPDIAATNGWTTTLGVHVYTGDGKGKFKDNSTGLPNNIESGSGTVLVDFSKDGNLDVTSGWTGSRVYLGNGGGGGSMSWTQSSSGLPTGGSYTGVDATDYNKDGSIDLLISSYSSNGLRAFRNNNNGASWTSQSTGLPNSGGYMDLAAADFNNDGTRTSYAADIIPAAGMACMCSTGTARVTGPRNPLVSRPRIAMAEAMRGTSITTVRRTSPSAGMMAVA